MDTLINIILWTLVVYHFSIAITELDGPFELFAIIRGWSMHQRCPDWITNGIHCPICVSFWLSLIVVLLNMDIKYFACAGIITLVVKYVRE